MVANFGTKVAINIYIQRVHEKTAPLSIMVQYSKYLVNITEMFTTEFSTHLYIVCKKFVKI